MKQLRMEYYIAKSSAYLLHVKMLQLLHTLYMNAGAVNIWVNSKKAFPNQHSISSG